MRVTPMRPLPWPLLFWAVLVVSAPTAAGSGESLSIFQMRIRIGNGAKKKAQYHEAAFVFQRDEPTPVPDLRIEGPLGRVWMDQDAPIPQEGLSVYDDVRSILANGRRYRALRWFGKPDVTDPMPDGIYTASSTQEGFTATTAVGGAFPEYPVVLQPKHGAKVDASFVLQLADPATPPEFMWVSVVPLKKGRLDFPPVLFDQTPWTGPQTTIPPGLLLPRRRYFVVVGFGQGGKIAASAVKVRVRAADGVLTTWVDEAQAEETSQGFAFVRKGRLPATFGKTLKGGSLQDLVFEIGSLDPLEIPVSQVVGHEVVKIETAGHPDIDDVKLNLVERRFRVRGHVDDPARLGEVDDVRVRVK